MKCTYIQNPDVHNLLPTLEDIETISKHVDETLFNDSSIQRRLSIDAIFTPIREDSIVSETPDDEHVLPILKVVSDNDGNTENSIQNECCVERKEDLENRMECSRNSSVSLKMLLKCN